MREKINPRIQGALIFQLGWWGTVLLASAASDWWWTIAPLCLALSLRLQKTNLRSELFFVLLTACFGFGLDSTLLHLGVLSLPNGSTVAPGWLILLWALFASSFTLTLAPLTNRMFLAAVLGAVFGPLSYAAGEGFHLIYWAEPKWISALILSLVWALSFVLLLQLHRRLVFSRPR